MRRIAMIGKCGSTRSDAPVDGWEIWGLADDMSLPHADRYFQMHPREHWERLSDFPPGAEEFISQLWAPVYMREAHDDLPNSVKYPFDEVSAATAVNRGGVMTTYLESSIGYELGLAIYEHLSPDHESVDKIGLWGVDLDTAGEYAYQKPNAEYLVGLAMGLGIKVYIPSDAGLCRSLWKSGSYGLGNEDRVDGPFETVNPRKQAMLEKIA